MKCRYCGAEVTPGKHCEYCGSMADYEDNTPAELIRQQDKNHSTTYIVKRGDTLWKIAEIFLGSGTRYPEIVRKNHIPDPDLIYPGQILEIQQK